VGPKTKYEKDDLIDAALAIAREAGLAGITARSVAKKLGCSVAPIYVNFETIDDLRNAVVQRVFSISREMLENQQGSDVFEKIGKASLAFAREYPILCRELTLNPNPYLSSYEKVEAALVEAMAEDPSMRGWSLDERRRLLLKMRVFQIGLTALVANGQVPFWLDDRGVEALLMEVGSDLMNIETGKREAQAS
jgi:AcrR family transcriptional regulator